MMPVRIATAIVTIALAVLSSSAQAATSAQLVKTFRHSTFGDVLARRDGQALYYWNRERDFRVHCTGACARAWPPLIVRKGVTLRQRVAGIKGKFGIVRRPDGRRQLTLNRRPLYTYAHERPRQVLCNDVDGWFVIRP